MNIAEIYFGFHRPATLREIWSGAATWTQGLGHVEAWGYTIDETWFFFDPNRHRARLEITHLHDEVEHLLQEKFTRCAEIIRYAGEAKDFRVPLHGPMNCVTQCAALIGLRAFTPKGFRKKLLAIDAEVIHGFRTRRERRRPQGKTA